MTEVEMKKEAVRTELLTIILDAIRELLKLDPSMHGINILILFRDVVNLGKIGSTTIKYPYQTN